MFRPGHLCVVLLTLTASAASLAKPSEPARTSVTLVGIAPASVDPSTRQATRPDVRKVSHPARPAERYGSDGRRLCAPAAGPTPQGDAKCKEMVRPQARDGHAPVTDI